MTSGRAHVRLAELVAALLINVGCHSVDGYTINFVSFDADIDATPLLKGLSGDSCQCPHWGYVVKGKLRFRFADHEEAFEAGDAFYLPPGHVPAATAVTEYVQFSPAAELREVAEAMTRSDRRMQQVGG